MISLRLSPSHETAIAALTRKLGVSRSQWLRDTIDEALAKQAVKRDPHTRYLALTQDLPASAVLEGVSGRAHSELLRKRFAAGDRRA